MEPNSKASGLFKQISIWQLMLLTTLAAIVVAVVTALSSYSATIYAFLLAPTILYAGLRLVGVVFRPAVWMTKRLAFFLGVGVFVFHIGWLLRSPPTFLVLIPVATLWVLQIAIANSIEKVVNADDDAQARSRWYGEWLLVGLSGWFILCTLGVSVYTMSNHVAGKGTVFDSYWMVTLSRNATQYDLQTGYEDVPWRCWFGQNRVVSGRTNPTWNFLGLRMFQPNMGRSLVHVPYAFTIFLASIFPLAWFAKNLKRFTEKLATGNTAKRQSRDRVD